jgi:hypothetical protein
LQGQVAVDLDAAKEGAHGRVQRGQETGLAGQRVGPAVAEVDAQPVAREQATASSGEATSPASSAILASRCMESALNSVIEKLQYR